VDATNSPTRNPSPISTSSPRDTMTSSASAVTASTSAAAPWRLNWPSPQPLKIRPISKPLPT